jgi:hypothetical protein
MHKMAEVILTLEFSEVVLSECPILTSLKSGRLIILLSVPEIFLFCVKAAIIYLHVKTWPFML